MMDLNPTLIEPPYFFESELYEWAGETIGEPATPYLDILTPQKRGIVWVCTSIPVFIAQYTSE